jgi:hypothetical protein
MYGKPLVWDSRMLYGCDRVFRVALAVSGTVFLIQTATAKNICSRRLLKPLAMKNRSITVQAPRSHRDSAPAGLHLADRYGEELRGWKRTDRATVEK